MSYKDRKDLTEAEIKHMESILGQTIWRKPPEDYEIQIRNLKQQLADARQ